MFSKKKYLEYTFKNKEYNNPENAKVLINDILEPSTPKSSCWWSSLKVTQTDKWKNYYEYLSHHQKNLLNDKPSQLLNNINTAKTCPGILGVLSNAYLIKSPADISITFDNNGKYVWNSSNDLISISDAHPEIQYLTDGKSNIFENKIAIKFELGVMVKTSDKFIYTNPQYHNNIWYDVAIGLVDGKYINGVPLNVIGFINKPNTPKTFKIEYGDVLSYLWFDKKHEMKHLSNNVNLFDIKKRWKRKGNFK